MSDEPILERNKSSMSAVVAAGNVSPKLGSACSGYSLLGWRFSTRTERCEPAIGRDIGKGRVEVKVVAFFVWLWVLLRPIAPCKSAMTALGNQETLQKINAALAVFATSTNKAQISQANDWLQDFQHTVSALSPLLHALTDPEIT
jgi:hypothetical protein